MSDKKRPDLIIIEKPETEEIPVKKTVKGHTNPIIKKLAAYTNENLGKFSVKDLFKK